MSLASVTALAEPSLVSTVGISIVTASVLAIVFNRLKIPAILAYIISGLLIGQVAGDYFGHAFDLVGEVAHFGLVFLLFIIGMEMDLTAIRLLGWRTSLACILQFPISFAVVYGLQWSLGSIGWSLPGLGATPESWIYYAVVASVAETAICVKLLSDKFDLGSQAGKITVITLVAQDIWAIVALSYVTSSGDAALTQSAWVLITGGVMAAACIVLAARFGLSRILNQLARWPELLMLISLGWCFLCAEIFLRIGLSAEMGALLAGLTIGRLPQQAEVFSRVLSLRDFFLALFFVTLGVSLPAPSLIVLAEAVALWLVLTMSRIILFAPTLLASGQGPIVSFAAPINLTQIGVFSLLVMTAGIESGHLDTHDKMVICYALLIGVIISAFTIQANYVLAIKLSRKLGFSPNVDTEALGIETKASAHGAEIIVLGLFVNTEALARHIEATDPSLFERIQVIDLNVARHKAVPHAKLRIVYGDFSNPDTLRHYGIESAKVVVSTLNNAFLHGTRNEELIQMIKRINPHAKIVTTALSCEQGKKLIALGAYECISPPDESAPAYTRAILDALASYHNEYSPVEPATEIA